MILCSGCPRSYHYECLDKDTKARSKSKINFSCPQHQCNDCFQKTADAGGMLFRCRWCERGFCEDCLDWEKTKILGDNLKEYELLGFPAVDQAWYIKCPRCTEDHEINPDDLALCEGAAKEIDEKYDQFLEERALAAVAEEETKKAVTIPSRDESLTDATTVDTSGVTTPGLNGIESSTASNGRKRKATRDSLAGILKVASRSSNGMDSAAPGTRKRKAAPKSFANSFENTALGLDDSDWSAASTGRKAKAASESLTMSPTKRSKRLTA